MRFCATEPEENSKSELTSELRLEPRGREQMPVFGQAPVLGGSGSEVLSNTQTTGAPARATIRSFQYGGPAFLVVAHPKPIRVRCSRLGETDGWLSSVVR